MFFSLLFLSSGRCGTRRRRSSSCSSPSRTWLCLTKESHLPEHLQTRFCHRPLHHHRLHTRPYTIRIVHRCLLNLRFTIKNTQLILAQINITPPPPPPPQLHNRHYVLAVTYSKLSTRTLRYLLHRAPPTPTQPLNVHMCRLFENAELSFRTALTRRVAAKTKDFTLII